MSRVGPTVGSWKRTSSRSTPPSGSRAIGSSSSACRSRTRRLPRSSGSARRPSAGPIVERALRIGLLALQDAGVTVNVDAVRTEFERMVRQAEQVNERAATALEQTLRANFADGDGRLPRTLEKFLGRPRRAAVDGRRAVRREEARQRDRADRHDARALFRWRRLEARPPARPDPPQFADAPVPPGDRSRLQGHRGAARGDRGRGRGPRRRAGAVRGEGHRLRGSARRDARRHRPRLGRPARPDDPRGRAR